MPEIIDVFLHIDEHLATLIADYGWWTYFLLFLIIFLETGIVITPFLPGDSLLFAAGALAVGTVLNVHLLVVLLFIAAVSGDALNYTIGKHVGPRVFTERSRFLKKEHLIRTQEFYERHGGKTIVMARFVPIIRTFAPFVAGIGRMGYARFATYNVLGGLLWVSIFLYAGFFFGNIPIVRDNFTLVILAVIALSLIPVFVEMIRQRSSPTPGVDSAR
jgi:membrane-associated protein